MEDVLDVYSREPDPENPRICFDERPILLINDCVEPLPMKEGKAKRIDYEYQRGEAVVALLAYNIDTGQRHVAITKTKKKVDYAHFLTHIMQTHYKDAKSIHLIQDNLNTHTKGSFYLNMPPHNARQFAQKLHFHFTPKHGSWLNMAEIEFSVLSRQCLNRRFDSVDTLIKHVNAWVKERNDKAVKIHWSFTVPNAHEKLARHYCGVFNLY